MNTSQNERLSFSSPVLLLGASPIGPSLLKIMQKFRCWPLLAADGGLNAAMEAGLLPQIVIGDMDSATGLDHLPNSVRQIRLSGQDDTDFEKCLKLIDAPLIIGIGFLDGRFDHSLAAMDALARLSHDRPVLLVASKMFYCGFGVISRRSCHGSRVSICHLGASISSVLKAWVGHWTT